MATLKSIKNKYLTASDGDVLGVTTNTENVSLLSFKLATADSLSKFNLVDGFTDDYNDATGADAPASTNDGRNSAGKYYSGAVTDPPPGGTITYAGGNTIQTFNTADNGSSTNVWTPTVATSAIEYLVLAGAGGGGAGGDTGTTQLRAGGANTRNPIPTRM